MKINPFFCTYPLVLCLFFFMSYRDQILQNNEWPRWCPDISSLFVLYKGKNFYLTKIEVKICASWEYNRYKIYKKNVCTCSHINVQCFLFNWSLTLVSGLKPKGSIKPCVCIHAFVYLKNCELYLGTKLRFKKIVNKVFETHTSDHIY